MLSADTLDLAMTLLDKNGRPAGSLLQSEEPRVAVVTGGGREVAGPDCHVLHAGRSFTHLSVAGCTLAQRQGTLRNVA